MLVEVELDKFQFFSVISNQKIQKQKKIYYTLRDNIFFSLQCMP